MLNATRVVELLVFTFAVFLALVIWFTVGIIVWIGLVLRASSVFAISIFGVAFTGGAISSASRVHEAARFWIEGLQSILMVYERRQRDERIPFVPLPWKGIFREILASAIVLTIYCSICIVANLLL